ncbi:MANBA mannosidase, partial [Acromyrmex heyeri]
MNMLRVWGGGIYESKLFYDLADEYGIMIWQDFMFACAMYPTSHSFLKSVKEEILQNVIRLKNHPSIVLWAGNNENEAALYGNWYGTGSAHVYREDYVKLYVNLLKTEVKKLDLTRPFVVSSPGNGALIEYIYESNKATKVTSFWLDRFLFQVGCGTLKSAKRSCIATLSFTDKSGSLIAPINYIYPDALKNVDVPVANVTMKIEENYLPGKLSNYADFKIVLSTDKIALFVWLEIGNIRGRFSENGFHMFAKRKKIIFHAYEATTVELLQSNIKLTHISDIYNAYDNFYSNYFVKRTNLN